MFNYMSQGDGVKTVVFKFLVYPFKSNGIYFSHYHIMFFFDVILNDGAAPSAGAPIYVSTTAGRGTATAPSTSGQYITCIGFVVDNTGYAAAGDTVEIMLNCERPVLI